MIYACQLTVVWGSTVEFYMQLHLLSRSFGVLSRSEHNHYITEFNCHVEHLVTSRNGEYPLDHLYTYVRSSLLVMLTTSTSSVLWSKRRAERLCLRWQAWWRAVLPCRSQALMFAFQSRSNSTTWNVWHIPNCFRDLTYYSYIRWTYKRNKPDLTAPGFRFSREWCCLLWQ